MAGISPPNQKKTQPQHQIVGPHVEREEPRPRDVSIVCSRVSQPSLGGPSHKYRPPADRLLVSEAEVYKRAEAGHNPEEVPPHHRCSFAYGEARLVARQ